MRSHCLSWLIAGLLLLWAGAARADTWVPATRQIIYSSDKHVRLTIEPRVIANDLRFFEDKVKGREPAGQRPGARDRPEGWLERRGADGVWQTLWRQPLVNDVSPVSAIVANDGRHVVTFDNWHFIGEGDNVIVIYGADGAVVRSMGLSAILPEDYIAALPRSSSSTYWGEGHRFSAGEDRLLLTIAVPDIKDTGLTATHHIAIEVALADGHPTAPSGAAWQAALRNVQVIIARQHAEQAAWLAPMSGPTTTGEAEWHNYLREGFFRLDAHWSEDFPNTTVLRDRAAPDYRASEKWVFDALLERDGPATVLAFASPTSPDNLVRVLTAAARKVAPGKLRAARIYVAMTDAYRDRIVAALAPTGATVIQLDPAKPIPQRPERIPGTPEQAAAEAAEMKRVDEMMSDAPVTTP